mgnify:CR=1 FL=1
MKKMIKILKSMIQKRKVKILLRRAHLKTDSGVFLKVLEALEWKLDTKAAREKLLKVQQDSITNLRDECREKERTAETNYQSRIQQLKNRAKPPIAATTLWIDYKLLDKVEETKARMATIKKELSVWPEINKGDVKTALCLMIISLLTNIYFMQLTFGDAMSSNEFVSAAINVLFGIIITAAEVIGPVSVISMLSSPQKEIAARSLSILGGVVLMVGVICILIGRGEIISMFGAVATIIE